MDNPLWGLQSAAAEGGDRRLFLDELGAFDFEAVGAGEVGGSVGGRDFVVTEGRGGGIAVEEGVAGEVERDGGDVGGGFNFLVVVDDFGHHAREYLYALSAVSKRHDGHHMPARPGGCRRGMLAAGSAVGD